ncbi:hypothetical protein [Adhaeribacter radiodurans]|uniref:Oligosaccharide flippase family protein n=1 Tax=Adhaeribacter radiodurans TaxID=2745197 RepID=A0A7L7L3S5_9BACT|nr:hypothetical protein [Adhaeribacter radiodurans]QMU27423.1 hypothetical protein HUW48_04945 [Adhaeribacter radiodurans]
MFLNQLLSLRSAYSVLILKKDLLRQLYRAAGLQALQMAIGATIGFLIIRNLSKEDYAIFNLLNTGSATLIVWAGFSVSSIFIPFANRIGLSPSQIRTTTAIFRKLNLPLLLIAVFVAIAFWFISAYNNRWLNETFVVGTILALLVAICQYHFGFFESAFKVSGNPLFAFRISLKEGLIRLILVIIIISFVIPVLSYSRKAPILLIGALVISTSWGLYSITQHFRSYELHSLSITKEHRQQFWTLLTPILFPYYFFYLSIFFRGSLIYLISGTAVIAEAAALGRLMALFAMMDKAVELVVLPRLGAITDNLRFIRRLLLSFIGVLTICSGLLLSAWVVPDMWLWILGKKYSNIGNALLWAVAASGVERLSGLVLSAQLARGETKNQWWVPLIATGVYFGYVAIIGLQTVEKATIGLFLSALTNLLAQIIILYLRLSRTKYIANRY